MLTTDRLPPLPPHTHTQNQNIKYFKVYRWDPEQNQKPYLSTYPVDLDECVPGLGCVCVYIVCCVGWWV